MTQTAARSQDSGGGGDRITELPHVLRCLFEEHRHLGALIRAMERKARQGARLQSGDYYLLRDIVGYLHDYPDRVHHPTENLLFEKLLERDPSREKTVSGLRRDHRAVAEETLGLLELLEEAVARPGRQAERTVRQACLAFARHQRRHMQFENHTLFPAAIGSLTPADWKEIETHFAAVEDPLFGRVVGNRHRLLYEYLVDTSDKAAERFSISGLFSLERLILTAELLEKNTASSLARIRELGTAVTEETRSTVAKSLRPESLVSALNLPVKYAAFLGLSLLSCGGDLARIQAAGAREALDLYTGRRPLE